MAQTSAEQMRSWQGPALFSFGFRPFFLFAAVWAFLAMLLWIFTLSGAIVLPTRFDPVSWHAHEFLFGYLGAVLAGFLLTAVPNWTGRLPIVGWWLAALFTLWVIGRVAVLFSALLPAGLVLAIDVGFPSVLAVMILREIIAGKNWRNLIVLALLAVFTVANALFHIEAMNGDYAAQGYGLRLALATAVMMIAVIGGRIVPSFTRNWLARTDSPVRPTPPMQRFDKLVLLASLVILMLWVVEPIGRPTDIGLIVLGVLHLVRLMRWQGHHTMAEPLVWVLHLSYAFLPAGALAMGFDGLLGGGNIASAQHLWTAGAIGAMTLAVMTRVTLGHSGRALTANRATVAIYLCLFGSVAARVAMPGIPALSYAAGLLWLCAFGGFAMTYGPPLLRAKESRA
ncbi:NnrS family protein [Roseovarius sp. D0-M9]|uniref:NnrS family protein n=1 Tax=Roseovarius sp. D0-M9 TaxID=3127117 RepID=UPI00300FE6F0